MEPTFDGNQVWSLAPELVDAYNRMQCYDVHIDLTLRCKGGCIFCFMSSIDEEKHGFSKEKLFELIDDTAEIGASKITWYGGEPLLREDWVEILRYAHARGLRNDVRTGGQPLHEVRLAEEVVALNKEGVINEISFHIDSIDRDAFMRTRKTYPSYFDEVISGIGNLLSLGYPRADLSICIVQTRNISGTFRKTVDWAIKELGLPLRNLKLTSFRPCGFGAEHRELECTVEELKENFRYLCELHGWDITKTPCLHECSKYYCGTMLHIEGNGELVPCSMMHLVVGNVNETRFRELFQSNRDALLLTHLRDPEKLKGQCKGCHNKEFCFGCRANAHNFLSDARDTDPKCWVG